MTCIVVLGSHGGGTSLVASILDGLGVDMAYNPNAKITVPKWTYANYEDSEMVRINNAIIKAAGGDWNKPPRVERLQALLPRHEKRINGYVNKRKKKLWGFKDPRLALTIHLIHPLLPNPKYIYIHRKPQDCAKSIQSRGYSKREFPGWVQMTKTHYNRIEDFVSTPGIDVFKLAFEDLTHPKRSGSRVTEIARFIGVPVQRADKAVRRVKHR